MTVKTKPTGKIIRFWFELFLSERTKERLEKFIISVAIISFLMHLGLVLFVDLLYYNPWGLFALDPESLPYISDSQLLTNPIAAIYTPFSFILLYEVYMLVYYLPKSISSYISKQYEIITLIVIRRIFKDMANIDLSEYWLQNNYDLQLTYDLITTLVLFALVWVFVRLNRQSIRMKPSDSSTAVLQNLVRRKKIMAVILVPLLLILALYSFGIWFYSELTSVDLLIAGIKDINQIFFDEFFTVLILADVLLLLFSLYYTDRFDRVIRNSGFIISTILLRLSFGTEGILNNILICSAVAFGVLILLIYNQYGREYAGLPGKED